MRVSRLPRGGTQGWAYPPPWRGLAPLDRDGNPIELHVRGESPDAPDVSADEGTWRVHRGRGIGGTARPDGDFGRDSVLPAVVTEAGGGLLADRWADFASPTAIARCRALAQLIRENAPEQCLGEGASALEAAACAAALGVQLPGSYRWFLRAFGFACWPNYIYGIRGERVRFAASVVTLADRERNYVSPRMPRHLVPFAPDGFGNHYCLDTRDFEGDECPVVFWNHRHGDDQTPPVTHATFLDWLAELVRDHLPEAP